VGLAPCLVAARRRACGGARDAHPSSAVRGAGTDACDLVHACDSVLSRDSSRVCRDSRVAAGLQLGGCPRVAGGKRFLGDPGIADDLAASRHRENSHQAAALLAGRVVRLVVVVVLLVVVGVRLVVAVSLGAVSACLRPVLASVRPAARREARTGRQTDGLPGLSRRPRRQPLRHRQRPDLLMMT